MVYFPTKVMYSVFTIQSEKVKSEFSFLGVAPQQMVSNISTAIDATGKTSFENCCQLLDINVHIIHKSKCLASVFTNINMRPSMQ